MLKIQFLPILIIIFCIEILQSQSYYYSITPYSDLKLGTTIIEANANTCDESNTCVSDLVAFNLPDLFQSDPTMTPEGKFIGINEFELFEINTTTGELSFYANLPQPNGSPSKYGGICAISETEFLTSYYRTDIISPLLDTLAIFNISTNSLTKLGNLPAVTPDKPIIKFNYEYYFLARPANNFPLDLYKINLSDPSSSEFVISNPPFLHTVTASKYCNVLIGISSDVFCYFNILDGSLIPICDAPDGAQELTSPEEFNTPSICLDLIDLDCDDSSGAMEQDFNSTVVDCHHSTAAVADMDIGTFFSDVIQTMTISISGAMPDAPFEFLSGVGSANIDVSGDGTSTLTLSNTGDAKSTDFKDALRLVLYHNDAAFPTAGDRTISVQFTTASGSMSNVATAFIPVVEAPSIVVDLGDDLMPCEGTSVTLDATTAGANGYAWSSGENDAMIQVTTTDEYIVTVTHPTLCPDVDTVVVTFIPAIQVGLTGETEICDNETADFTITSDAPFPVDVTINVKGGNPFEFTGVSGMFTFSDLPTSSALYEITNVLPSEDACVTINPPEVWVEVLPSYQHTAEVSMCQGDSVWLGFYWEHNPGVYEIFYSSTQQCDSVVTYTVIVLPAVQMMELDTTCIVSESGTFIIHLDNPNGCDTVVTRIVSLEAVDTTFINSTTCGNEQAGSTTDTFQTSDGCDSLVITTLTYSPPSDTTHIQQTTCDLTQIGSVLDTVVSTQNCDSLILTTTVMGEPDTNRLFTTSCDPNSLGVFIDHYTSINMCDSVVITTVTFSASDSTFINSTTCDPSEVSITLDTLINRFGCDSIIITTTTLAPSDQIDITSTTCDPSEAGVFTNTYTNQWGCDSIVTETITLLPSHNIAIQETTCRSDEAGIFITELTNQHGCDSIITTTVTLIQTDTTFLSAYTCDPGEVNITYETITTQQGCDSIIQNQTLLHPLPIVNLITTIDYNGYPVSCYGASDGSIEAVAQGIAPFTYNWSSSTENTNELQNIPAGEYSVTVTDQNNCTAEQTILLTQPNTFTITLSITHPDCFEHDLGTIQVNPLGGVPPYLFQLNNNTLQTDNTFTQIGEGIHTITTFDANGCEVEAIVGIQVPIPVNVDLGMDQEITVGDTTTLQVITNIPIDSIQQINWTSNVNCDTCLTQIIYPIITSVYAVEITSTEGCSDKDTMQVSVLPFESEEDIYIPNVFTPNDDGINDIFSIHSARELEIINLNIYDRWGTQVWGIQNKSNSDPDARWDGKYKGRECASGVYAYRLLYASQNGNPVLKVGDVTVVR